MNKISVVFTGGGTAGHVMGNLSIMQVLKKQGIVTAYIGSKYGIEKDLITEKSFAYYEIATGKWRRYLSFKNFTDLFLIMKGIIDSFKILRLLSPKVIFSKGGFVSFPVVLAGWLLKIPVVIHEADLSFGLANRLALKLAKKICVSFPETLPISSKYFHKKVETGLPLREEIFKGSKKRAMEIFNLKNNGIPVLLIIGGSLGSKSLNEVVEELLPMWIDRYQIIHVHGNNFIPKFKHSFYHPYSFLNKEMADALLVADLVISRAGANSIAELLALRKVNLLVPLIKGSRGDQLLNAKKASEQGYSMILPELSKDRLATALEELEKNQEKFKLNLQEYHPLSATKIIAGLLKEFC